jgi:outer membrane murein-binding lipoprotein Lpp
MRKQIPALLAAFLMTGVIALSMGVVGVNALYNSNSTTVSNAPVAAASAPVSAATMSGLVDQAKITQLESLVSQYQAREQQYQQREQQYQQQLQTDQTQLVQATNQIQQFQQLLVDLQDRGIISVDQNGTITILARRRN